MPRFGSPPADIPKPTFQTDIQDRIVGEGPLTPVILRLAWPVVLMMYLQGSYNIIDSIWVGQLLGRLALAGIATGGFVLWSILPRPRWPTITVGAAVWLSVPVLFYLMGTSPEVTKLGTSYLRVLIWGCPAIFLSFLLQRIFQAAGDTVTPMWLMFFALIVTTVLDPVLMLGLLGLPRLGVEGAALATLIARLLMVLAGIGLLLKRRRIRSMRLRLPLLRRFPRRIPVVAQGYLRLQCRGISRWDWRLFASTLRIGAPNALTQVLFPVV
ncbi:MAG: MATE family efflux transporter [Deltaproteobacteria bacterium]